jgi:hypothetical protein
MRNFILGAVTAFVILLATGASPQQVLTNFESWLKVTWQRLSNYDHQPLLALLHRLGHGV